MKRRTVKNVFVMVQLCALIAIVGIALNAASNAGSSPKPPRTQKDTARQKAADTDMPSAAEQRRKVQHADEANFAELVLSSDVPVLVGFYADWCGPCRMLAPVLEELAREKKDGKIVRVNVDESPELAARYKITSIPSLKVFDDGQVVDQHVGVASKGKLKNMLDI